MQQPGSSSSGRRYTLRPSKRDHHLLKTAKPLGFGVLPGSASPAPVDHRPLLRPIRDQGQKGYCFAFATALVKEANCVFWEMARGGPSTPLGGYLSPDYVGWKTQTAEGNFGKDEGASLADSFASVHGWGVAPETFLPYDPSNPAHAGDSQADVAALPYRFGEPCVVAFNADAFAQVLASNHVIAMGFCVYPSFEDTGPDGVVKPTKSGEPLLGGHAVNPVGFELSPVTKTRYTIIRNSWGDGWGDKGYGYIEDSYFQHVFDGWTTA